MPTINGEEITHESCGMGIMGEIREPNKDNRKNQEKQSENSKIKTIITVVMILVFIDTSTFMDYEVHEKYGGGEKNTSSGGKIPFKTIPETVAEKYYIKNILKGCDGVNFIKNPACFNELKKTGIEE